MVFIKNIFKVGLILLVILVLYIYYQIAIFRVERVSIELDEKSLNKKLKLIQISDYHNNNLINKDRLLKTIKKLYPHIIVLTGDIIDGKTDNFDKTIELLSDIKEINSRVYFVSGNHEMKNKKREKFERELKEIGIYNLDYKYETLRIENDEINLCGIPFYKNNNVKQNVGNDLPENLLTILLSHSPKKALQYENLKSDLILSGHIHGGQVRLPFIGALVSPEGGFLPKYNKGLYNLDKGKLYIDSGLGNSVKPIRLFNRVQISYIEIK